MQDNTMHYPLKILHRAWQQWMKVGLFVSQIINTILLAILFFLCFTPIALLMRLRGKDAMKRAYQPESTSYWIARTPHPDDSMRQQF